MRRVLHRRLLVVLPSILILLALVRWKYSSGYARPPKWLPQIIHGVVAARSKVIVVGKTSDENTDWVERELSTWDRAIYTVDNKTTGLHPERNKGREANVYLTYLIANYDKLPDIIVFLHAHRDGDLKAWHVDNKNHSNVESIRSLQLDFVERKGYVNLRCEHEPGCYNERRPLIDPPLPVHVSLWIDEQIAIAWPKLFGKDIPIPTTIGTPCCAQFAVTRDQVRKRPKSDYEHYHRWLMDTDMLDALSGRVLEYTWHIIFGQKVIHCPEMKQCYCDLYGLCGDAEH